MPIPKEVNVIGESAQGMPALSIIERRKAWRMWLISEERTQSEFAAMLNLTEGAFSLRMGMEHIPVEQYEILVTEGEIPPYLLPIPKDVKPGRKRKVPDMA